MPELTEFQAAQLAELNDVSSVIHDWFAEECRTRSFADVRNQLVRCLDIVERNEPIPRTPHPSETETPSVAPLPEGYARTHRKAVAQGGIEWRAYKTRHGIGSFKWVAEIPTHFITIHRNHSGSTYSAYIDKALIGERYRSEYTAMEGAAKAYKAL